MATQLSQEEMELLTQEVLQAAEEGRAEDLRSALSSVSPDVVKDILHHQTSSQVKGCIKLWKGTPLSIAAQRGHLEVVKLLVEDFNVDLNQRASAEGFWSPDITALMCASQSGHLDIVKLLVTKGCVVNLTNERSKTALYWAWRANHLEVVKFLVENGAEIDAEFDKRLTFLMAACQHKSEELVEYLLEKGADVNKETNDKLTALHMAARENSVNVVKILLKNGATISNDSEGHSPLIEAAGMGARHVVSFFIKSSYFSQKEKIDGLQLLGACMVRKDRNAALGYLRQAMVMRQEDPLEAIPRPHSIHPAPSIVEESRTLEELEARGQDPDQLRLECLAIVLRVVGPSGSFAHLCLKHAFDLLMLGRWNEALAVFIHALHAKEGLETAECSFFQDVMRTLSSILFYMMTKGPVPRFSSLCEIFQLSLEIVQQKQPESEGHSSNWKYANLCLLCISVGLEVAKGQEEMAMLRELAKSLIHLQPSPFRGGSILHATVSTDWDFVRCGLSVKDQHLDSVVSFLLQCDADVNAVDNNRNRPLHILAKCPEGHFDAETLRNLTHILVEAGAPVFVLNGEGETPLDIAVTEEVVGVLRKFYPVSLRSLAATAVVKHGIPYAGQVPEILKEFLHRH